MILLFLRLVAQHADRRDLDSAVDPRVDRRRSTLLDQTLNVMTLGGMALAVGILVDDATVEIENNHRHMDLGTPLRQAILDGAAEVATPALVSTLSICIVFVPIFLLSGVGGFLFCAAGHGGRVRDAGELFPVAHAGADHVPVPDGARSADAARPRRGAGAGRSSAGSRTASKRAFGA